MRETRPGCVNMCSIWFLIWTAFGRYLVERIFAAVYRIQKSDILHHDHTGKATPHFAHTRVAQAISRLASLRKVVLRTCANRDYHFVACKTTSEILVSLLQHLEGLPMPLSSLEIACTPHKPLSTHIFSRTLGFYQHFLSEYNLSTQTLQSTLNNKILQATKSFSRLRSFSVDIFDRSYDQEDRLSLQEINIGYLHDALAGMSPTLKYLYVGISSRDCGRHLGSESVRVEYRTKYISHTTNRLPRLDQNHVEPCFPSSREPVVTEY